MNNIIVNQTFGETETTCNWIYSTIEMSISIEYIATITRISPRLHHARSNFPTAYNVIVLLNCIPKWCLAHK